ncbi:hypothetical protein SteCoe_10336 [Stentor coeruleus]|uniref:EamA domain-containing protein n=1 Tax=Stentor coeruleus TaxID=5963 RepID=A0A1R2CFS6_9CILI|nr:hypothetical protein SteCoe_10336 [Stentor coeruleus]
MADKDKKVYKRLQLLCIFGTMASGTWSTLTVSYLDKLNFTYALFQVAFMFIGEFLCYFIVYGKKICIRNDDFKSTRRYSIQPPNKLQRFGKKIFIFTAFCDFIDSFLQATSYNYLSTAAIMGFKMLLIFFIFLFRKFVMKRNTYRHQILGLIIILIGMLMIGVIVFYTSSESKVWGDNETIGFFFMFISQIFHTLDVISIEYFMWNIEIEPEEVVGIKGLTGIIICLVSYVPLHYLLDPNDPKNSLEAPFKDIDRRSEIAYFLVMFTISISIFNFFMVKTIKINDSLSFCTLDSGRMIIVWALSLAIFTTAGFNPFEPLAAFILAVGLLIYNEVLVIPLFGFDRSVKKNIKDNQTYKDLRFRSRSWQLMLDTLTTMK